MPLDGTLSSLESRDPSHGPSRHAPRQKLCTPSHRQPQSQEPPRHHHLRRNLPFSVRGATRGAPCWRHARAPRQLCLASCCEEHLLQHGVQRAFLPRRVSCCGRPRSGCPPRRRRRRRGATRYIRRERPCPWPVRLPRCHTRPWRRTRPAHWLRPRRRSRCRRSADPSARVERRSVNSHAAHFMAWLGLGRVESGGQC